MATESKKHHYVPQSVLARFSIRGEGRQVYVFDKSSDRVWPSSIADAGSENYFNTIDINGKRVSFESAFQYADDRLALLLDRIEREKSLAGLAEEDLPSLADVVAVQLVRTKLVRTSMRATMEGIGEAFAEAGLNPEEISNFRVPSDQDMRRAALAMFVERDAFRDALVTKHVVLLEPGSDCFWTSDNPVQMFNSFPYGEIALNAPGIEIYYPFSSVLALAFYCPSIERKISQALTLPEGMLVPELREQFRDLREAIVSGKATRLSAIAPRFLNELQVRRSSRYLYAAGDDFSFARDVLARNAELRGVESLGTVGRMGSGPPPKPRMPAGVWLVLYGRENHFMLAVSEWNEHSRFIEVSTADIGALAAALRDQPLQQATVFRDGAEMRGMRQIKIEILSQGDSARIRIVHSDGGLNAILEHLGAAKE